MRYAFSAILGIALVACSSLQPTQIRAGEVCFRCGRVITDTKLAAQLVGTDGQASNFRTAGCLAKYLQKNGSGVKAIFVTDHPTGELFPVTNATFVRATIDDETGERDFLAFRSVADAGARAKDERGAAVDWATVRTLVASEKEKKAAN